MTNDPKPTELEVLEKYAKYLAKQFVQYSQWQYTGKNGANSDNEKGYWRGMADCVAALLQDLKHNGLIAHSGVFNDNWPSNVLVERRIKVFNFEVTYLRRPNDDIYTAHVPAEIIITVKVPENFNDLLFTEQQGYLRELVLAELDEQITFDTPDAPEFEIEDVEFELEDITNEE